MSASARQVDASHSVRVFAADQPFHPATAHDPLPLGSPVRIETLDCYAGQVENESDDVRHIDDDGFDRATGPLRFAGVRAGDWVRISIGAIELDPRGVLGLVPGLGAAGWTIDQISTRIVEVAPREDGRIEASWAVGSAGSDAAHARAAGARAAGARTVDSEAAGTGAAGTSAGSDGPDTAPADDSDGRRISVPARPMIGILGVLPAPDVGETPSDVPGPWGGNLDTPLLRAGASLHLRANTDGLGLLVGDLHARQGDGELGGTGIESAGTVTLTVDRTPPLPVGWPVLRLGPTVHILVSQPTLDGAVADAFEAGVRWLSRARDLPWEDAYRLASIVGDAQISQVVNASVTARYAIDRRWLELPR